MDYYSFTDPGGTEGWVGLVGWPIAESLREKWSPVNDRSGIGQARRPKTDVLTTQPRRTVNSVSTKCFPSAEQRVFVIHHGVHSLISLRVFVLQAATLAGVRGSGTAYLLTVTITNLMQAFWFGANFLLYCGCAVGRKTGSAGSGNSGSTVGAGLLRGRGRGKSPEGVGYQLRATRLTTAI